MLDNEDKKFLAFLALRIEDSIITAIYSAASTECEAVFASDRNLRKQAREIVKEYNEEAEEKKS